MSGLDSTAVQQLLDECQTIRSITKRQQSPESLIPTNPFIVWRPGCMGPHPPKWSGTGKYSLLLQTGNRKQ